MGQRASSFFTSSSFRPSSVSSQPDCHITLAGQATDLFLKKRINPTFQGKDDYVQYTDELTQHIDQTWRDFKKRNGISRTVESADELSKGLQESWDQTLRAVESVYRRRQKEKRESSQKK